MNENLHPGEWYTAESYIYDGDGNYVCRIDTGGGRDRDCETALLIVRAVNAKR